MVIPLARAGPECPAGHLMTVVSRGGAARPVCLACLRAAAPGAAGPPGETVAGWMLRVEGGGRGPQGRPDAEAGAEVLRAAAEAYGEPTAGDARRLVKDVARLALTPVREVMGWPLVRLARAVRHLRPTPGLAT